MSDFKEHWAEKVSTFAKPGDASHSAKWDRCVQHVADNGNSANAYAVCTAALGDDTFKSMDEATFLAKVDEYIDRLNISAGITKDGIGTGFAGPVPNSLLARQDLEPNNKSDEGYTLEAGADRREGQKDGFKYKSSEHDMTIEINNGSETSEKSQVPTIYVCFSDGKAGYQERAFGNAVDAYAYMEDLKQLGYSDVKVEIGKGRADTSKDIIEMAEETDVTKAGLAERIKAAQLKKQNATIAAREAAGEAVGKSFAQFWAAQ